MEYVEPIPVVDHLAVDRFADAVNRLLDGPARRADMGAAGRRRVEIRRALPRAERPAPAPQETAR